MSNEISWIQPGVVKIRFADHPTGAIVEDTLRRLEIFVGAEKLRGCFLDAGGVSAFDSSVRGPGRELLTALRARGVERAVCLTVSPLIRMIGSTLSFASGLPVLFVATEAEAMAKLREQQREPAPAGQKQKPGGLARVLCLFREALSSR